MKHICITSNTVSNPIFRQFFGCSSYSDGSKFLFVWSFHQHFGRLNRSLIGRFCEIQKPYGILFDQLFSFLSLHSFKPIVPIDATILLVFYKYHFSGYRVGKHLGKVITASLPEFIDVFSLHLFKHKFPPFLFCISLVSFISDHRISLCKTVGLPSEKNDTDDPNSSIYWNTKN